VLLLFTLLFGNIGSIPIGIVNKDQGLWGARLEQSVLRRISPLGQVPYFAKRESDETAAIRRFNNGRLAGVLIIPEDFSRRVRAQADPRVVYYIDNYNTDFAKNMRLYLEEGVFAFYAAHYDDMTVRIRERVVASVQAEWIDVIAVGTLLLAFVIGGMFSFLYVFFKELRHGTLIVYRTAPARLFPSFLARIVAAVSSALLAGCLNAGLAWALLGRDLYAALPQSAAAITLTTLVYISAAAVFCTYARSFYGGVMGSMVGALVLWFFSGGLHAVVPENPVLLAVYRALPNSYALDHMRGVVFGSPGLPSPLIHAVLAAMAAVAFVAAAHRYRSYVGCRSGRNRR
jgi:ABC-type transport system involved in cytochrome c biogenesis permease component